VPYDPPRTVAVTAELYVDLTDIPDTLAAFGEVAMRFDLVHDAPPGATIRVRIPSRCLSLERAFAGWDTTPAAVYWRVEAPNTRAAKRAMDDLRDAIAAWTAADTARRAPWDGAAWAASA